MALTNSQFNCVFAYIYSLLIKNVLKRRKEGGTYLVTPIWLLAVDIAGEYR
jgi:hypothetical protein